MNNYSDFQAPPDFYTEVPMNIFILDLNYTMSARLHPDKLLVKMVLESCQMLCSVVRELNPEYADKRGLYKTVHLNHPCSIWARASKANFIELIDRTKALHTEYLRRGYKEHKSYSLIRSLESALKVINFRKDIKTDYARCFNASSGLKPNPNIPVEVQYRQYILSKSYTQPSDPIIKYLGELPSFVNITNPTLKNMKNILSSERSLEIKNIALETGPNFDKLSEILKNNEEVHVAYYYLLNEATEGSEAFELIFQYQVYCQTNMELTQAPAVRKASPKSKKVDSTWKAAKRKMELEKLQATFGLKFKFPSTRSLDTWTDKRFFLFQLNKIKQQRKDFKFESVAKIKKMSLEETKKLLENLYNS